MYLNTIIGIQSARPQPKRPSRLSGNSCKEYYKGLQFRAHYRLDFRDSQPSQIDKGLLTPLATNTMGSSMKTDCVMASENTLVNLRPTSESGKRGNAKVMVKIYFQIRKLHRIKHT